MPQKLKLGAAMIAIAIVSFTAGGTLAQGRYPFINQAEGALNNALGILRGEARDVFGGHKVAAEGLIQQALGELQAGKAFAAAHGN
jgi:hypothetical protein